MTKKLLVLFLVLLILPPGASAQDGIGGAVSRLDAWLTSLLEFRFGDALDRGYEELTEEGGITAEKAIRSASELADENLPAGQFRPDIGSIGDLLRSAGNAVLRPFRQIPDAFGIMFKAIRGAFRLPEKAD